MEKIDFAPNQDHLSDEKPAALQPWSTPTLQRLSGMDNTNKSYWYSERIRFSTSIGPS